MSDLPSVVFGDGPLRWQELVAVARHGARLELSAAAWARIDNARAIVCRIVANGERAYGISTGLGALCDVLLEGEQLAELSRNTLLSHACGSASRCATNRPGRSFVPPSPTTARASPGSTVRWWKGCWRCSTTALPRRCRPGLGGLPDPHGARRHRPARHRRGQLPRQRRAGRRRVGGGRPGDGAPGSQGRALPGQRHAVHDRPRLPGPGRRAAPGAVGRRDRGDELRGPARPTGGVRRRDRCAQAASRDAAGRRQSAGLAGWQPGAGERPRHPHPGCPEHPLDTADPWRLP